MGLDFLRRVRNTSIAAGFIIALAVWIFEGPPAAAAFAAGCAWSLVNLHVIRLLIQNALDDRKGRTLRVAAAFVVKIPVLYAGGYLAFRSTWFPVIWLLAGSAWPFAVIVLKAAGRAVLGLDRTERNRLAAPSGDAERGA
jgi:hypothetical protein